MKVALISPIGNLEYMAKYSPEIQMALTPFVLKNADYAAFFAKSKAYKLLDNGAYENELCNIDNVLKAAEIIKADEIVLPDILFDAHGSIQAAKHAIEYLREKKLLGKYKLMFAIQGKNPEQWLECYQAAAALPEVDVIGLSKVSCPVCWCDTITNARLEITKMLDEKGYRAAGKEHHLLGGSFQLLKEIELQPAWIRSIDTSIPFEWGKRRRVLQGLKGEMKFKAKLHVSIKEYCKEVVEKNINSVLQAQKKRLERLAK